MARTDDDRSQVGEDILKELQGLQEAESSVFSKLGITFNPFPPAGIPRHAFLPPIEDNAYAKIRQFVLSTYQHYDTKEFGEYAGLAIEGEFGMGKTHLMQFVKSLIDNLNKFRAANFAAVTCYIDRPEDNPQLVIHKIIEQIGIDNLRKYLWAIVLEVVVNNDHDKFFKEYWTQIPSMLVTKEKYKRLFDEDVKSNPLLFLEEFRKLNGDVKKLQVNAKEALKVKVSKDETIVDRYVSLIFPEKKTDTSWEILTGYIASKDLRKKEVQFLNSVVSILRTNGYNMLYVFIDEFEDVSKFTSAKFLDYVLTLNTLINGERHWAVVISITPDALRKIQQVSAPLFDRLTTWRVPLRPLDKESAKKLLINYLNIARKKRDEESIFPFTDPLIDEMLKKSKGNYRTFVRVSHKVIEHAKSNNVTLPLDKDVLNSVVDQ